MLEGAALKPLQGGGPATCSGMEIGKLLYPMIPEPLDISLKEIEHIGQDVQCRAAYNSKKRQTPDYL